jgi:hypothetical protein
MEKCKNCNAANGRLVQRPIHGGSYELVCVDEQGCWSDRLKEQLFRGFISLDRLAQIESLTRTPSAEGFW